MRSCDGRAAEAAFGLCAAATYAVTRAARREQQQQFWVNIARGLSSWTKPKSTAVRIAAGLGAGRVLSEHRVV
ncbi:hypothetical protein [Nocardia sp. NPDC049707]|uniref:hypothetical protein n=1 Tax=Nocardia sp. NPDC049707 TaxID=3154735 RepID=UPI00343E2852